MNVLADPISDHVLVRRVQLGDKLAFDLLVKKYRCRIFRIASKSIRNPSDVEDLVQDTFVRAYRAIDRFRGDATFYTWLYRIALNVVHSYHQRQITSRCFTFSEDIEADNKQDEFSLVCELDTPESIFACKQMAAALSKAIESLPGDFAKALYLRELDELSYEEIATQLGCPVGTVRSRIFRAREIIANCLQGFGYAA
jgi:RNA polymerase sigma-70 factor (ECF subfamily)